MLPAEPPSVKVNAGTHTRCAATATASPTPLNVASLVLVSPAGRQGGNSIAVFASARRRGTQGSTRLRPGMRSRPRSKLTNAGALRASAMATWKQSAKERLMLV